MTKSSVRSNNLLTNLIDKFSLHSDITLALGMIAILLILLFPVPTWLLDICLAFSITTSILLLMTTLFITRILELSIFPTLLLVTTMLRLSLNIASTRLILSNGHKGTFAAGHVIEAFGSFVMQNNIVIGLIVFLILTLINFIVITKGSGRIAEVAARFSLDAMPGKQMAIDSDLSAGIIDEETAKTLRRDLENESSFYGSMDGANKFVRGDAIAGIIITFINLVGGIFIGVIQKGLTFEIAMRTYTILTIGDGLVTQIPSLIISLSTGLLVSKAGISGATDKVLFGQLSKHPQALWLSSVLTAFMSLLPGVPMFPFMIVSVSTAGFAYVMKYKAPQTKENEVLAGKGVATSNATKEAAAQSTKEYEDSIAKAMHIDVIKLELGYNLLILISKEKHNNLTDQIKTLRKQIAQDLGFIIPSIRIQDNVALEANQYTIKIKEIQCGSGEVLPNKVLVMDPEGGTINLNGTDTFEPAFGLPAKWIDPSLREEAIYNKYTIVEASTVVITHLTELVKDNIVELLTYNETQKLVNEVSEEYKKFVKEVVPDIVPISTLQKILQNLLSEMVSIRDLPTIIEATAEGLKSTSNLISLTENIRGRLARQISYSHLSPEGYIPVIVLSSTWEQNFISNMKGEDKVLSMPPSLLQEFMTKVNKTFDQEAMKGVIPVLLTSSTVRPYVRSVIERFKSVITVLSENEVHPKIKVKTLNNI